LRGRRARGRFGDDVVLWHVASGTPVLALKGHRALVHAVAFHPDGTQLASSAGLYVGVGCSLRSWGRTPGLAWSPAPPDR
jgi:WD40 repeat protein